MLKSWAMPPASVADRVHLLLLNQLGLERPLLGRFERIHDRGFLVALLFGDTAVT